MFISSFKYYKDLVENPGKLPKVWTLKNYYEILAKLEFPAAFSNSVISAGLVTVVALFTSAALGYVFAKYKFLERKEFFSFARHHDGAFFCGARAAVHHHYQNGSSQPVGWDHRYRVVVVFWFVHDAPIYRDHPLRVA